MRDLIRGLATIILLPMSASFFIVGVRLLLGQQHRPIPSPVVQETKIMRSE